MRGLGGARLVAFVALAVRVVVIVWARDLAPAADGIYYHALATRLAAGAAYTWEWPDGVVTYAAHYPVGYPALVALGYAVFGARPVVALALNALVGAAGAVAAHDLVGRASGPRRALTAGLVVALHPALVPYTAAIMTEGVTASLITIAAAFAARARGDLAAPTERREPGRGSKGRSLALVACGLTLGLATLVRPQTLLLAPCFGWIAGGTAARWRRAAVVTALALATCAPWTARNCVRMNRCALVSVNGGWNLAIGAQTSDGAWHELIVPPACREVFAEAEKDACFEREARAAIVASPWSWLARAPRKLRATFDYFGAAPWYLREAAPARFDHASKIALGAAETLVVRLILVAALAAVALVHGPRPRARIVVGLIGLVGAFSVAGAAGYVACAVALVLLGERFLAEKDPAFALTFAVLAVTGLTHVIFFGAGRYGLVVVPLVTSLAFARSGLRKAASRSMVALVGAVQAVAGRRRAARGSLANGGRWREESPSSTECDAG